MNPKTLYWLKESADVSPPDVCPWHIRTRFILTINGFYSLWDERISPDYCVEETERNNVPVVVLQPARKSHIADVPEDGNRIMDCQ